MKRTLSIAILAILILSILPLAAVSIPKVAAQSVTIETSRDAWGNVWKNQYFYVDVEVTPPSGTNITLAITVAGTTYFYNATRIGSTNIYRAWFYVNSSGYLIWIKSDTDGSRITNVNATIAALSEGDVITFSYGGVSKSLQFKHVTAELSIRSPIPKDVAKVGILDWKITAPDLNRDPEVADEADINITIKDYTANYTITFRNVHIVEDGENSGVFEIEAPQTVVDNGANSVTGVPIGTTTSLAIDSVTVDVTFSTATGNVTDIEVKANYYGHNLIVSYTVENITNGTQTLLTLDNVSSATIDNTVLDLDTLKAIVPTLEFYITITSYTSTYDVSISAFNLSISAEYLYSVVKVLNSQALEPGNVVEVWANVSQYQGASADEVDVTSPEQLEIKVFYGTVTGTATLKDGLTITVNDLGRNYRTYVSDSVDVSAKIGTCGPYTFTLSETDVNTGTFETTIDLKSYYVSGCLNATNNVIEINYTDSAGILRTTEVKVQYFTGEILSVEPSQVVPGRTVLTIKIKDPDLNLAPDTRETYPQSLSAGDEVVLPFRSSRLGNIVLGELHIYAVIDGKEYPAKASTGFNLVAIEDGRDSDTFTIVLDLSKVDLSVASGELEAVKIAYEDLFTPDLETKWSNVTLPIAKVSIEVYESEVPINAFFPVKVHIKVVDPSANINPGKADEVTVTYTIYNVSGGAIGHGSVTLTETGWDTGVFEGVAEIDLTKVPPSAINGHIEFTYTSAYTGETVTDTVALRVYPASIEVNATEVAYGEWIEIKVIDKEFDLDQTQPDEFTAADLHVKINGVPPDLTFKETGNDTGVFVATIQVSKDLGNPASYITITHEDYRPIYATPEMGSWSEVGVDTSSVQVYIKSFDAKIGTDKDEYGPAATISLWVYDPDRNENPDKVDNVTVKYLNPVDNRWHTITLEETGENTGNFTGTLDVSTLGAPEDVIGKTIRFIYVDPYSADGSSKVFFKEVKIVSWTGEVKTDKTTYNLGEKIKITVTDPDQNLHPDAIDSVVVHVYSDTDPAGTYVTLYETSENSGVFTGEVLISNIPGPGRVMASEIDVVHIEYVDPWPAGYPDVRDLPITVDVNVGKVIEKPMEVAKTAAVNPQTGEPVTEFKVGTLAGFKITLNNVASETKTVAVIAVIQDPNGVTISVQAVKLPIAGESSADVMFTFVPKLPGTYTVKIYIVKGLAPAERTIILSPEPEYTFTITVTK